MMQKSKNKQKKSEKKQNSMYTPKYAKICNIKSETNL
jgi:hypothetical protein